MITISPEELPNRAFQLAYFLHRERKTATEIATRALNKLELAAMAQGKRLYYRLTGRADARKARSKVSMGEPHILQRLVYVESESYERRKEAAALDPVAGVTAARQTDLVVYFIKHLVRITTRRNSFYVTLGLSRLLYNYTTPETMELYNLVIQDPDRVHDDYYYRSRKGLLLKELKERFGELLETSKGARGEQRWRPSDDSARHAALARECLLWFTPWATPCVVPERFDPFSESIHELNFEGRHPDEEHEVEVNRIHATLHPDCFARLAAANRLPAPDERLELPHFFLADGSDDQDGNSRIAPDLSPDELQIINSLLAQEAGRRKAVASGFFRVLLDGVEVARIEPARNATASFMVNDDAELIEVYAADEAGPLLMATHLLSVNRVAKREFNITLEAGQKITFAVSPVRAQDEPAAEVAVSFQETSALKRALSGTRSFLGSFAVIEWPGLWKPAAAFAVLALLIVGAWMALRNRTKPAEVVIAQPTPATSSPTPSRIPEKPETARNEKPPADNKTKPAIVPPVIAPQPDETQVARTLVTSGADVESSESETRGGLSPELKSKALSEVRRAYLQLGGASSGVFRSELESAFRKGSGLQLSGSETADAALKISIRPASADVKDTRVLVTVRAVSADGKAIWPVTRRPASWRYVGQPRYVAERIVADLTRDIEGSKR